MIEAVLKLQTVNISKLALIFNPTCQPSSNYRRLQRFVANFDLDILLNGKLLASGFYSNGLLAHNSILPNFVV